MNYQGKDTDVIVVKADTAEELQSRIADTTQRLIVHNINYSIQFEQGSSVHVATITAGKKQLLMEG